MKRLLIRIAIFAVLVFGQAATVPVGAPIEAPETDAIVACESQAAADTDGVSIGTALRLHRTEDVAAVAAECIGTVSRL
jgi:hypothetical protein